MIGGRMRGALCAAAVLVVLVGCQRHAFYEYDDEPYLSARADATPERCRQMLQSPYWDEREIAMRLLATRAREHRMRGEAGEAARLIGLLVSHYRERERDPRLRSVLVGICLRDAGVASPEVVRLLREAMARGETVIDACHTAAALRLPDAYSMVAPFLEHPRPEVRYEAALALTTLGDSRGRAPVLALADRMYAPAWPERLGGMPLAQRREALRARSRRMLGAP
ncbi:MAG: hypothetical protein ACOCX4_01170 [Planctomycetota bacterium]